MKFFLLSKNSIKKDLFFFVPFGLILILNIFLFIKFFPYQKKEVSLKLQNAPINSQYLYQNKSKDFAVYLGSRSAKQTPEVKMTVENSSIEFRPENNLSNQTKLAKQDSKSIVYKNIYPGVDFAYSLTENGVKEEIKLNSPQTLDYLPNGLTFKLNLNQAIPQKDLMGQLTSTFVDPISGNYLFHFEKPFMIDAGGNRSNQVDLKIQQDSAGFRVILIPDQNWLKTAIFPVVIDPTITHNQQSDYTSGQLNRVKDVGTGATAPSIELYEQELPTDINTVGLWHLNETSAGTGSTAYDSSTNNNNGIGVGTSAVDGKLSKARSFNGTSDYINSGTNATLSLTTTLTLEAWIKPSALPGTAPNDFASVAGKYKGVTSTGGYRFLLYNDGKILYQLRNGASVSNLWSNTTIPINTWSHIAATTDGVIMSLYINGTLSSSQAAPASITTTTDPFYIGQTESTYYFNGSIDEVRISNIARTPEEIKLDAQKRPYGIYTSPSLDLTSSIQSLDSLQWSENGIQTGDGETLYSSTNLVAQWNFNETSGVTASNAAGSCGVSCNGTLTGFANTSGQDVVAGSGWTANNRKWGAGALMFDGSNDYVYSSYNSSLNITGNITLETWIFINAYPASDRAEIITRADGSGGVAHNQYYMNINTTGNFSAYLVGTSNPGYHDSNNILSKSTWHHVAWTYDGSAVKIYIDGNLDKSVSNSGSMTSDTTAGLYIGASKNSTGSVYRYFNGIIDSPRLYSRALTAAEILANYQAGNIEFQTRTSANNSTWEEWRPTGVGSTAIDSMDSTSSNWNKDTSSQKTTYSYTGTDQTLTVPPEVTSITVKMWGGGGGGGGQTGAAGGGSAYASSSIGVTAGESLTIKVGGGGGAGWGCVANTGGGTGGGYGTTAGGNGGNAGPSGCSAGGGAGGGGSFVLRSSTALIAAGGGGGGGGAEGGSAGAGGGGGVNGSNGSCSSVGGTAGGSGSTNGTVGGQNPGDASAGGGGAGGYAGGTGGGYPTCDSLGGAGGGGGTSLGTTTNNGSGTTPGNSGDSDRGTAGNGGGATVAGVAGTVIISYNTVDQTISKSDESTIKMEGSGSMKTTVGVPLTDANTKGLWHFDETGIGTGSTAYDSTTNNNHGIATGTTLTEGFYGKARSFNGSSDYININDSTSLDITGQITLEAWIKMSSYTYHQAVVTKGYESGVWAYLLQFDYNTAPYGSIGFYTGPTGWHFSTTSVPLGQWSYVVATYNTSTGIKTIYINGVQSGQWTGLTGGISTNNAPVQIGRRYDDNYYFNGQIDEVRISNTTRTAEEIAETYRAGRDHRIEKTLSSTDLSSKNKVPFYVASDRPGTYLETYTGETANSVYGADANTKGLWHLDEKSGSGAYIKDSSGNANHGTPTSTTFTQGKIGGSRSFNGTSDYISVANNSSLNPTSAISVSVWFKNTATSGGLVVKRSVNNGYRLVYSGSTLYWSVGNGTTLVQPSVSGYNDGNWHFAVGTYDSSNAILYVDGVQKNTSALTGPMANTTTALLIGDSDDQGKLTGTIDEVRVDNVARTADEIRQAYQYGLRTHQITVDYSTGIGSSAPTSTSDVDFNPTTTTNLYVGDTVIVREKVGATTYIMQGEVTSISSGAVTVSSWSGTAPPSGYTTNANVFKWQREYWDITDISTGDRDAITKLGIRVLDATKGFDMYLDDFRSNQNYLTTPAGSSITSTAQRYFQYRSILTTNDTLVSPALTSVTLNYTTNQTPTAPTSLLTNGLTNPTNLSVGATSPYFSAVYNDPDATDIANKYQIQVDDDSGFGSTIWDTGSSGTSMNNCNQGTRCSNITYGGSTLTGNTTYYWRIKYWDDDGAASPWSSVTNTFSVNYAPTAPTSLLSEAQTNPTGVTDTTPEFSAIYNDLGIGDTANKYQIQVDDDSAFGSTLWNSGASGTSMTNCNQGNRCSDISYGGTVTDLQWNTKYYWRIKYWDVAGLEGAWSTESAYFTMSPIYEPTSCMIDDSGQPSQLIVKWNDNTILETGYRIERSVDSGAFSLLTTEAVNSTSSTDNTTSSNHTYRYQIRANSNNGNSQWCGTETINYNKGNLQMKGVLVR